MTEIAEPQAALPAATRRRGRAPAALPLLVAGCFLVAALSLVGPSVPTQDSWSWIVWGREVAHLALDTTSGSSWKPLPVLFTTPFSLFGDAAPELWLVVARAGGLLAILFAYRIAARLAGPPLGVVAGAVAGLSMASADWLRYLAHGNVEPLSAGLVLGAVDRHLDGKHHQAAALGFLAALGRPELFPFLLAYALVVLRRKRASRVLMVALLLAVPALWLGGDWWGAGDPFYGSSKAAGFADRQEHRTEAVKRTHAREKGLTASAQPSFGNTLKGGSNILMVPVELAALVAIGLAIRRRRRDVLVLAAGALTLILLVALMVPLGYGGSPRFMFPAAAIVCVLAGLGVAWLLEAARTRARMAAVALALIAATVPFAVIRAGTDRDRVHDIRLRTQLQDSLDRTIAQAGGRSHVRELGHPRINPSFSHQLAWDLDVPMDEVGPLRLPAVIFRGPQTRVSPGAAPRVPRFDATHRRLAAVGGWKAYLVRSAPGRRPKPSTP
ncbi:MAG: hypothetical protein QOH76_1704 [Thermoleophilaceae bacterium]|nr:hypothetical protein [Thermoleophilaceae bacterium]